MKYTFKEKKTLAVDGSKVLPFNVLNAELLYPERQENKDTTKWVHKMAVEVATCILKELRDPKKASADYLSSEDGKFSWGITTQKEHELTMGKICNK